MATNCSRILLAFCAAIQLFLLVDGKGVFDNPPQCTLTCINKYQGEAGCDSTNYDTCLCTSAYQALIKTCINERCPVNELAADLATFNIQCASALATGTGPVYLTMTLADSAVQAIGSASASANAIASANSSSTDNAGGWEQEPKPANPDARITSTSSTSTQLPSTSSTGTQSPSTITKGSTSSSRSTNLPGNNMKDPPSTSSSTFKSQVTGSSAHSSVTASTAAGSKPTNIAAEPLEDAGGLSMGAKAGLAVVILLCVILTALGCICIMERRRRKWMDLQRFGSKEAGLTIEEPGVAVESQRNSFKT